MLCDENTAIACHKGYLTGAVECGSDVCVTSDDPNFQDGCRDPQSVCFGQPDRWVCDVHEAIRCTQMFIDDAESCADCTVGADGKLFSQFNGQKCGF